MFIQSLCNVCVRLLRINDKIKKKEKFTRKCIQTTGDNLTPFGGFLCITTLLSAITIARFLCLSVIMLVK